MNRRLPRAALAVLLTIVFCLPTFGADDTPKGTTGDTQGNNGPIVWSLMATSNDAGVSLLTLRVDPATKRLLVDSVSSGSTTINGPVTVVQPTASSLNAKVQGDAADGAAVSGNPVRIGGKDGLGNAQDLAVQTDGTIDTVLVAASVDGVQNAIGGTLRGQGVASNAQLEVRPYVRAINGTTWFMLRGDDKGLLSQGAAADGAAVSGNPNRIAGKDGSGNTQDVATDTAGNVLIAGGGPVTVNNPTAANLLAVASGPVAVGSAVAGNNPVLIGGTDGTNARIMAVDGNGLVKVTGTNANSHIVVGGNDGSTNRTLATDSSGRLVMIGSVADGAGAISNPVRIGAKDSAGLVQDVASDASGVLSGGTLTTSADGVANTSGAQIVVGTGGSTAQQETRPFLYNATSWDREYGNVDATLLASAARTATTNSADQTNYNARGVWVALNITVVPGGDTVTLAIQGKDPVSGNYVSLLTGAAQSGTGITEYVVYPGVTETANVDASRPLPRVWRVAVTHSGAGSFTYSVGASMLR